MNSHFIVTARMDFQILPKFSDFRSNTVNIQSLGRTHSSTLISGWGSGDLELEHSHPSLSTSLKSE